MKKRRFNVTPQRSGCKSAMPLKRCKPGRLKKPKQTRHIKSLAVEPSLVQYKISRRQRSAKADKKESSLKDPGNKNKVAFESLEALNLLGIGAFGMVFLGRNNNTSRHYAIKKLEKEPLVKNMQDFIGVIRENRILKSIDNPFLVSLKQSYQDTRSLYFVMEFANGGDLCFHLEKSGVFSEERTRFYSAEVTLALSYLHDRGIVYRDLKLENILMDTDGHVKIADFGLSKDGMTRESRTSTFCGTDVYTAPEVILFTGHSFPADWWSFGIIVFEMLNGCPPFYSDDQREVHRLITEEELEIPDDMEPEPEDLVRRLLVKDPNDRIGVWEVVAHEFFKSVDWTRLRCREVQPPFVPKLSSESDLKYFDPEFTKRKSLELFSKRTSREVEFCEFEGFDFIRADYDN